MVYSRGGVGKPRTAPVVLVAPLHNNFVPTTSTIRSFLNFSARGRLPSVRLSLLICPAVPVVAYRGSALYV